MTVFDCVLSGVRGRSETLYNVMRHEGRCPKCGSRDKKILGGQEFLIKEIGG